MKKLIYMLPTITVVLAVFKLLFCTGDEYFCLPWTVLFFPVTIYGLYFMYGLVKSVREAVKASPDNKDIDIDFR